jgi:hypothetical protein
MCMCNCSQGLSNELIIEHTCVEAVVVCMELSNYLVENVWNWLKCLWTKKVMPEIFEDQIFCANVHNGNVNRAPSSPIIGHVQILTSSED